MDKLLVVLRLQKVLIAVLPENLDIILDVHQGCYTCTEKGSDLVNIALLVRVYYNLNVIPIGQHILLLFFY